jgi:hypothetical protein
MEFIEAVLSHGPVTTATRKGRPTQRHHEISRIHSESFTISRGHCGGDTPGNIPNPEVKPSSADGTAGATRWESRSPREPPHRGRPRAASMHVQPHPVLSGPIPGRRHRRRNRVRVAGGRRRRRWSRRPAAIRPADGGGNYRLGTWSGRRRRSPAGCAAMERPRASASRSGSQRWSSVTVATSCRTSGGLTASTVALAINIAFPSGVHLPEVPPVCARKVPHALTAGDRART